MIPYRFPDPNTRRRQTFCMMVIGLIGLVLVWNVTGCQRTPDAHTHVPEPAQPAREDTRTTIAIPENLSYRTATVQKRTIVETLQTTGRTALDPTRRVLLTALQRSIVRRLAMPGETVERDSVVAVLEPVASPGMEYTLRTPLNGLVYRRFANPGEIVDANARLLEIVDLSVIWVWVDIPVSERHRLSLPVHVKIQVPGQPEPISGHIDQMAPQVGADRLLKGRVILRNRQHLPAGLPVRVVIYLGSRTALVIPKEAVVFDGVRAVVARVTRHNGHLTVSETEVTLGTEGDTYYEVLTGLQEGDTIITRNAFLILKSRRLREAIEDEDE